MEQEKVAYHAPTEAITTQPAPGGQGAGGPPPPPGIETMQPAAAPGVPQGLAYLAHLDQLLVHQQVEIVEVITEFETGNKYQIKNSMGQPVYFASEESGFCAKQCCGSRRGFVMHIGDNFSQEVIRLVRDFKCCACGRCCACANCCSMTISVESPVGTTIGHVKQSCSVCVIEYTVEDADHNTMFSITGPCCRCQGLCFGLCCRGDIEFVIRSGGHRVGVIGKQWGGVVKELVTQADNYSVTFPKDLDVRMKATLLGAIFLIDYMYYEKPPKKDLAKKD